MRYTSFEVVNSKTGKTVYSVTRSYDEGSGKETLDMEEAGNYYIKIGATVRMDLNALAAGYYEADIRIMVTADVGIFYGESCTLIGSDGFYSFWSPQDYIYAKRDSHGKLQIRMRGDIDIRDRANNKLV
ncbi:MAG: hypothetical protein LIP08_13050 [Bacteroides sp.]|nr:hypothetical protein [Bacteroides sp.]